MCNFGDASICVLIALLVYFMWVFAGEIPGTLHARVYETYQKELIPGTVLILQKVTIYCMGVNTSSFCRCQYSAHLREGSTSTSPLATSLNFIYTVAAQ